MKTWIALFAAALAVDRSEIKKWAQVVKTAGIKPGSKYALRVVCH